MIVLDQIFKVFHARDGAKVNALKDVSLTVDEVDTCLSMFFPASFKLLTSQRLRIF